MLFRSGASTCPGLIPLHTLIALRCLLDFGSYENGDGLLGIRVHQNIALQRLLLTDSGHYLLPIDNFGKSGNKESGKKIRTGLRELEQSVKKPLSRPSSTEVNLHVDADKKMKKAVSFQESSPSHFQ